MNRTDHAMYSAWAAVVLSWAFFLGCVPSAEAQSPSATQKDASKEQKPARAEPRVYKKPEAPVYPDGPAEVLSGDVVLVKFDGMVNPGMGEFTVNALKRAEEEGAQALLIELNTPGGLVTTTEKIVQGILSASLPVIVFVTPSGAHAASAGTFITLAGHVAAMSPASRMGAAHPVTGGGKDPEASGGTHMAKKVENDLAALVEGIAKARHRNVEWAVDAVRESVSADAEYALEIGAIDLIARSRQELFEKIDKRPWLLGERKVELRLSKAKVVEYTPSTRERLLNLLANPGIAMLLGLLGLIGIMIEVYHPGLIIPGVMGVLCVLCTLIAMEQLPIDVGAAILALAGVALLIAEIYTPTYGALGILGVIGLSVGSLLLIDAEDPDFALDPSFSVQPIDIVPVLVLFVGLVGYLSYFLARQKRQGPVTGSEGLVGSSGRVLKPVGPEGGTVFVAGEYWQASADELIPEDEEVEVVQMDGLRLTVRRKNPKKPDVA